MISPDKDVIASLYRLRGDISFQRIIKWIQDSYEEQSFRNNHEREEYMRIQRQGRNLELEEFLDHYKNAEADFKRLQEPKKGMV
jgi:hypothetical protein